MGRARQDLRLSRTLRPGSPRPQQQGRPSRLRAKSPSGDSDPGGLRTRAKQNSVYHEDNRSCTTVRNWLAATFKHQISDASIKRSIISPVLTRMNSYAVQEPFLSNYRHRPRYPRSLQNFYHQAKTCLGIRTSNPRPFSIPAQTPWERVQTKELSFYRIFGLRQDRPQVIE